MYTVINFPSYPNIASDIEAFVVNFNENISRFDLKIDPLVFYSAPTNRTDNGYLNTVHVQVDCVDARHAQWILRDLVQYLASLYAAERFIADLNSKTI